MRRVAIKVLDPRLGRDWPLPEPATAGSAGIDLRAMPDAPLQLAPGASELVATGMALHLADPGLCALILPRSGLGHRHGLVLGNGTGVIDSDYQGPLLVSCWNRSAEPFTIHPGDRIAQLLVVPVVRPVFERVECFEPTARGAGGFGSSGRN